ncbi:MAG: Fur family transcriptional regulator [Acidimicrobiales bacterium]
MAIAHNTAEEILSRIRGSAKRVTGAKRRVAEVLVEAGGDLTADEVTQRVQGRSPDVSPSTVYRILEEFETLGIIVHAHLGRAAAVYHLAGTVHGHLVCERCGATVEIPSRDFDTLSRSLAASYGFVLDRHHVALSGTCAGCRRATSTKANP